LIKKREYVFNDIPTFNEVKVVKEACLNTIFVLFSIKLATMTNCLWLMAFKQLIGLLIEIGGIPFDSA